MNKPNTQLPSRRSVYLATVVTFLLSFSPVDAQYAAFAATNQGGKFLSMALTGDSSAHVLTNITIRTNGTILGRGVRYDVSANAVSPSKTNGTSVLINSNTSKIGVPVVVTTNTSKWTQDVWNDAKQEMQTVTFTNRTIDRSAPCGIFLSDGARIKGVVTSYTWIGQTWNGRRLIWETNSPQFSSFEGVVAISNKIGSGYMYNSFSSGGGGGGSN
jgi:hypothetical protein